MARKRSAISGFRPGLLRHQITLQDRTSGMNGETWSAGTAYWGLIEPLRGQALILAQAQPSQVGYQITFRDSVPVSAGQRAVHDSVNYLVESVQVTPDRMKVALARVG